MTHVVTSITDDNNLTVNPDYRGAVPVNNTKAVLTKDTIIPQTQWNIDKCDGTGKSGYNIEINKMQMIGFSIPGMVLVSLTGCSEVHLVTSFSVTDLRTTTETVKHSCVQVTYLSAMKLSMKVQRQNLQHQLIILLPIICKLKIHLFPNTGVVYVDNELIDIQVKNNTTNRLLGLTRSAQLSNFVAGAQRSYTAGPAEAHSEEKVQSYSQYCNTTD